MKKCLWTLPILVSLLILGVVVAQTVTTFQDTRVAGGFGITIPNAGYTGVFSVANPQWTGFATDWIQVDTKRTICFDIDLVDASAGITSIDMSCYTAITPAGAVGTGYQLPVFTATSVTGVTSSVPSTIRQTNAAGGAPGTSSWPWCVTNIPGPFIMCSFTANGIVTAVVDTIAVFSRGITP